MRAGRGVRWRWLGAALVAVVTAGCAADPAVSTAVSTAAPGLGPTSAAADDPAAASDRLLETTLDAEDPGCSAAVAVDGVVVWQGARGLASLITGRPITADTVFDIGAVTKQFTAAAVLLLALDGRLATTDPVGKHLAGLPAWSQDTTLDSLMRHTAGLPDLYAMMGDAGISLETVFTQDDAMRLIAGIPGPTPRRGDHAYSNTGYVLLAEVVRVVSGQSLAEFLQQRILGPLGLTMTLGHLAEIEHRPVTYQRVSTSRSGWSEVMPALYDVVGPSGLRTTTAELARWGDNYRTGAVGGRELLDAQLADPVHAAGGRYAAGIQFVTTAGMLGYDGWWDYGFTEFRVSPDRHVSVAVGCNAELSRSLAVTLLDLWS